MKKTRTTKTTSPRSKRSPLTPKERLLHTRQKNINKRVKDQASRKPAK